MNNQEGIRLQKFLAQRGVGSRRFIEDCIRDGRIRINGKRAELGNRVTDVDCIEFDGSVIKKEKEEPVWIVFYKPIGVECTCSVPREGELTLSSYNFTDVRVFPVGRLDKESEGLLLLTNDGEMANQYMHPRYEHEKEYEVVLQSRISDADLDQLASGIEIEEKLTAPARVDRIDEFSFRIILKEGRNRQIRRMCGILGYTVLGLKRVRMNDLYLEDLRPGEWKILENYTIKI